MAVNYLGFYRCKLRFGLFLCVVSVDIWDGANDEPVIYHGYTLTSKILVKDVLQAVRDYAFIQSPCVVFDILLL